MKYIGKVRCTHWFWRKEKYRSRSRFIYKLSRVYLGCHTSGISRTCPEFGAKIYVRKKF